MRSVYGETGDGMENITMGMILDLAFGTSFDSSEFLKCYAILGDLFGPMMMGFMFIGQAFKYIPNPIYRRFTQVNSKVEDIVL